ncbi:MAG: glycosyltransferase family 2 protein [Planctomycetia bacterium]|nr:glycosyltransferase family 2 protein [Planctomycetia bacterium]
MPEPLPTPSASEEETDVARRLAEMLAGDEHLDRIALCESLLGVASCRQLGIYRIPAGFRLSVVIPVYNEIATLAKIVERVRQCGLPTQIVLVDDGSTDGSRELLEQWRSEPGFTIVLQPRNQGKGAALRAGFAASTGDIVAVQDADLEYDPSELPRLAQPIIEGQADVVFGSRFRGDNQRVLYFWHYVGNRVLTLLSNAFTNLNLSDMETCYKLFRRDVIQRIAPRLRENRFGFEPEITAKVAALPEIRVHERPISYAGRTYAEGKKITWRDGFRALWCIVKYRRG